MNLSEAREKFVTELALKPTINSSRTVKSYLSAFDKFTADNTRFYRMSVDEIKNYLATIREQYSNSYYNVIGSVVKIAFDITKQPRKMDWFRPISTKAQFSDIVSYDEFVAMGKRCNNIKQKLILVLLYSTGVRVSELVGIKLADIHEDYIFVRSLKGGKNRRVQLHDITKKYIAKYLKQYHPSEYLLEGWSGQYSASSVQHIMRRISNGKYHPHSMRHAYLTNVIEHENVFKAKELAGHSSLSSTLIYYHIPQNELSSLYNPLDA